jgi:arginase family enzyme
MLVMSKSAHLTTRETFRQIEEHVTNCIVAVRRSSSLGGDHSILLPILRATSRQYPELTVIQFDAHTDTSDEGWGQKFHHGTPVRRAIEEDWCRGTTSSI